MEKSQILITIVALVLFAGCSTATDSISPTTIGNAEVSFKSAMVVKAEDSQGYEPQGAEIAEAMYEAGAKMKQLAKK